MKSFVRRSKSLDDKISAEEVELLEKKKEMKELLKERRRTKVDGGEIQMLLRVKLPRWQSSKAEVDHTEVSEVEVHWKGTEEGQVSARNVAEEEESSGTKGIRCDTRLQVLPGHGD